MRATAKRSDAATRTTQGERRSLRAGSKLGAHPPASLVRTLGGMPEGDTIHSAARRVGAALVGIVTFGSLTGSMLPFLLQRLGFDPATASAPFVATLVDVTGLVIYFSVAMLILRGTLL